MADELLNAGQGNTDAGEQDAASTLYGGAEPPKGDADGKAVDDLSKPKTDASADGEKPDGGEGDKGGEQGDIEYTFEMPEGFELNVEIADEFKAYAKALKLPKEKAQDVVNLGVKLVQDVQEKQLAAFEAQKTEWREAVVSDTEIGGAKLAENLTVANKAIDQFFAPEFRSLLESTGLGNHPVIAKGLVAVGKAISEDRLVAGARGMGPRDPAEVLYGKK